MASHRRLGSVLGTKALARGPGFDEGAVDAEAFIEQQFGLAGLREDVGQEQRGCGGIDPPLHIGGKRGMVPDLVVQSQTHEPPGQDMEVDLLHKQSIAANRFQQPANTRETAFPTPMIYSTVVIDIDAARDMTRFDYPQKTQY